jgi:hypothetical protein
MIYGADPVIDKVLTNLRRTIPASKRGQPFQEDNRYNGSGNGISEWSKSSKPMLKSNFRRINMDSNFEILSGGISDRISALVPFSGFNYQADVLIIKELMGTAHGVTFNTNALRIALNMQEERIASIIVAFYPVMIDEEMILRAAKTG